MVVEVASDHCTLHPVADVVHLLQDAVHGIMGMGVVPTVLMVGLNFASNQGRY